jgi:DNA-binding Xre family transcriptional regulator
VGGAIMAIKYYKLLDILQRKEISKGDFSKMTGFSSATVAKLSTHKPVNMDIIDRVCKVFNCQPGDILEYVPEEDINS